MTDYASFLFVKPAAIQEIPHILLIPKVQYCIILKNLP
jgi:hypothetical protein